MNMSSNYIYISYFKHLVCMLMRKVQIGDVSTYSKRKIYKTKTYVVVSLQIIQFQFSQPPSSAAIYAGKNILFISYVLGHLNTFFEGHPTTYFSKRRKISLKRHYNYEEQQHNGFWTF